MVRLPACVAFACLVALLFAASAWATAYQLRVYDHGDDGTSFPESHFWDVNDRGVATGTATSNGSYSGIVTDLGGIHVVFPQSWLRGINDLDHVAGHNALIDLADGSVEVIPPVSDAFNQMWAQAVNNNDVVVGLAAYRISGNDNQVAFIWDRTLGTRAVPVPSAKELLRLNDDNVAVGNIRPTSGSSEAFIYDVDSGAMIDLHRLLNPSPPGYSIAADINDLGVVTGEGWNGSEYRAFVWDARSGFTWLPNLGGGDPDRVHPTGINDAGAVVGYALTRSDGWRGFIWDPVEGMRDLNDLIADAGDFVIDRALRISDSGRIVGTGHWGPGPGTSRAFISIPDPSPVGVGPGIGAGLTLCGRPNPFQGSISVAFGLAQPGPATLAVHDLAGRRVAVLFEGRMAAGTNEAEWSARGDNGERLPAGGVLRHPSDAPRTTHPQVGARALSGITRSAWMADGDASRRRHRATISRRTICLPGTRRRMK